jgi:hypothetical protein
MVHSGRRAEQEEAAPEAGMGTLLNERCALVRFAPDPEAVAAGGDDDTRKQVLRSPSSAARATRSACVSDGRPVTTAGSYV